MTAVIGKFLAVAEFEAEVLEALDLVEAIYRRSSIAGDTFHGEVQMAYESLCRARYEVDAWKEDVATKREP